MAQENFTSKPFISAHTLSMEALSLPVKIEFVYDWETARVWLC